jgi:hypothetical protein
VCALQVGAAAALRVQSAASPKRFEDAAKQGEMVADPVEGGRAEHQIGPGQERQRRQRDLRESHAIAERRPKIRACLDQHGPRPIRLRRGRRWGSGPSARRSIGRFHIPASMARSSPRSSSRAEDLLPQPVCGPTPCDTRLRPTRQHRCSCSGPS